MLDCADDHCRQGLLQEKAVRKEHCGRRYSECTPHSLNVLERFFQEKNVSPVTTVDILSTEGNPEAVGEVYKESDEERMDEGDGESKRVCPKESEDVSRKRRIH